MPWTDYASAPPTGTRVCRADEVTPQPGTLTVTTARGDFPLLLVTAGGSLRAYVNACPHQYLPLEYRGTNLLSADGTRLLCTAHGAMFDVHTGDPVAGADCALDAVPIRIIDGDVYIVTEADRAE